MGCAQATEQGSATAIEEPKVLLTSKRASLNEMKLQNGIKIGDNRGGKKQLNDDIIRRRSSNAAAIDGKTVWRKIESKGDDAVMRRRSSDGNNVWKKVDSNANDAVMRRRSSINSAAIVGKNVWKVVDSKTDDVVKSRSSFQYALDGVAGVGITALKMVGWKGGDANLNGAAVASVIPEIAESESPCGALSTPQDVVAPQLQAASGTWSCEQARDLGRDPPMHVLRPLVDLLSTREAGSVSSVSHAVRGLSDGSLKSDKGLVALFSASKGSYWLLWRSDTSDSVPQAIKSIARDWEIAIEEPIANLYALHNSSQHEPLEKAVSL